MNKGLGIFLVGLLAIIGGAAFAAVLIKNKLTKEKDEDSEFDDYDSTVDDEEFEHFFGDDTDENEASVEEITDETVADDSEEETEEQL